MDQQPNEPLFDFSVSPTMSSYLRETAKWSKFISIVGFILIGLMLIGLIFGLSQLTAAFSQLFPDRLSILSGLVSAIVVVAVLIIGLLMFLLNRFSVYTKEAVERQDQKLFNRGLKSLKLYFIIYGIIMILSLLGNIIRLI